MSNLVQALLSGSLDAVQEAAKLEPVDTLDAMSAMAKVLDQADGVAKLRVLLEHGAWASAFGRSCECFLGRESVPNSISFSSEYFFRDFGRYFSSVRPTCQDDASQ